MGKAILAPPFVTASPADCAKKILQREAKTTNHMEAVTTGSSQERLYIRAKNCFDANDYSHAIVALRELLYDQDYKVKALANIGACLYHLKHYQAALKYLNKALAAEPDFLPARFNLANSLFALGNYQEAGVLYGHVIEGDPGNDSAYQGKFDSLLLRGETDGCEIVLEEWHKQLPESKGVYLARALLLRNVGKNSEAIKALQGILVNDPDNATVHALISEILVDINRHEDALTYSNQAIRLNPENIGYHCSKANIHYLLSQVPECAEAFAKALAIHPSSASLLLNQYLLFPIVPASSEEIERCRSKFLEGLSLVENNHQMELILQHPIALHTFSLAYHNHNDRLLLERYMELMKRLADPHLRQFTSSRKALSDVGAKSQDGKVRIGFLSRYFYGHSNTMAFQGLIRHLNRDKFVVVLIHAAYSRNDRVQADLNACCDEVIDLSNNIQEIYHTLLELSLDILYFTDMGMSPYDFLLPMIRACKIQITGWGIPHTSGNRDVDYYLSAEGLEPADADKHYTEKLIRLPGGLPCCFLAEPEEVLSLPREYFFLPSNCQLIGCLQSLHKIHPDFDLVMEEIAKQNPDAIFVFVEDAISHSTELFLNRLSRQAPAVRDQSLFLRIMGREEYQALCRCMDLLLDPIYYGSGITFFEAGLVGTPIITLEGSNLRSRTVCSGYREMGLNDAPVVSTISEYVSLASDLLSKPKQLEKLRNEILNKNHLLFNRMDFVRNCEKFFLSITNSHNQPT
jgi:protein O-GlcNAc transferase